MTKDNVEKPYTDPITGKFVEGNPGGGRPKGSYSVVELIKKKLQEKPEGKDKTYGEYFVEKIMKKIAVDEDVSMMRDIINRVDGMPMQRVEGDLQGELIIKKVMYGGDDTPSVPAKGISDTVSSGNSGKA